MQTIKPCWFNKLNCKKVLQYVIYILPKVLLVLGLSGVAFGQPTKTSLSVFPEKESALSQQVTLTATVKPATATGVVAFYADTSLLGSARLNDGTATLTTRALSTGKKNIYANYLGEGSKASSRSTSVAHQVRSGVGISYSSVTGINTGTIPVRTTFADLNKDGIVDLITPTKGAKPAIEIRLGNGDGTFQVPNQIPYPYGEPFEVVALDVDHDGNIDLVIVDFSSPKHFLIFKGSGDGSFYENFHLPGRAQYESMVTGDFNEDGYVDIAVATRLTPVIDVYFGNGVAFDPPVTIPVIGPSISLAVADFNQDGHADIAVAAENQSAISFLYGYGDGNFRSGPTITETQPLEIVTGDINNDGYPDLVSSSYLNGLISVFMNDTQGGFSAVSSFAADFPYSPVLGDMNGDGFLDFAFANTTPMGIDVYLGDGSGGFSLRTPLTPTPTYAYWLTMGDLNNDHIVDMVAVHTYDDRIDVLIGESVSTVSIISGTPQSTAVNTTFPQVMQVLVSDSGNNPVSGATVSFKSPVSGAGGTFESSARVLTDGGGIATSPLFTANGTGGSYNVVASVLGSSSIAPFSLTNIGPSMPGTSTLTAHAGSDQSAHIGNAFEKPLQVSFLNTQGIPVAGVPVTFTLPISGPGGAFTESATVLTGVDGIATAPDLIANHIPGTFEVKATVTGANAAAIFRLTNIETSPAALRIRTVANAASYLRVISGDALVTIFGENFSAEPVKAEGFPLPTELMDISVTVDGYHAPLLYVDATQVNFQLPDVATLKKNPDLRSVVITVHKKGHEPYSTVFPLQKQSPGIFMIPQSTHAAARNQDLSLNLPSNPVAPGGVVLLYTTGLGPVDPPIQVGEAAPLEPLSWTREEVSVSVGNEPAKVLFSGLAPGFAGLMQINLEVPDNLPEGEHSVIVRVGGSTSNSAVISVGNPKK